MSQIEMIAGLPSWRFTSHCEKEIRLTGQQLVDESDTVWQIGNVAVAGFIYYSFVSPPWMWFVIRDNVTIADLIDFRRAATYIPKGTTTAVESQFTKGLRFAKIYGFEEIGEEIERNNLTYKLMRKV